MPPPYGYGAWDPSMGGHTDAGISLSLTLQFYWTQIRRHWVRILSAVVIITLIATILTLRIPKQYASSVTLRVDPTDSSDIGYQRNSAWDDSNDIDALIATEMDDVTSRAVVLDAIHTAHLERDAHLNPKQQSANATGVLTDPDAAAVALVPKIQSMVSVQREGETRNFIIFVRSTSPQTAAKVANALANALIDHEFSTRVAALNRSTTWMTQQLADLRASVERTDQELVEYQRKNNLVNPNDRENLINQSLEQLNTQLGVTRGEVIHDEAELKTFNSAGLSAIMATVDGAQLAPDYDRLQKAERDFAVAKARSGPANPVYQEDQEKVAEARAALIAAQNRVAAQIRARYQEAVSRQELVGQSIQQQKDELAAFNSRTIDYDILKRDADTNQRLYNDLLQRVKVANLSAGFRSQQLRVTDPALPSFVPVYPNVRKNVETAFLFSLLACCALAIGAGYLDRSFTSPDRVEQELGIQMLGALPAVAAGKPDLQELMESVADEEPESQALRRTPFAEAVLTLRTAVLFSSPERIRTFCMTSSQPQEGKSSITANLATALALHGSKVLLIDADIRRPSIHRIFDCPNRVGLSSVLRQAATLDEAILPSRVENLMLMPAGPSVPAGAELLATGLSSVLEPLKSEFDYILIDCPALLGFADALAIALVVDGVLVVARAGKTPREEVRATVQQLRRVRANVLGLILNGVSATLSPQFAYYHRSDYYQREPDADL
jgi:capsular exopolysaccharide synthesis family protein